MNEKSILNKFFKNNQSIWLKMKSPFGEEQYIPRIIDITAGNLEQNKNKSRRMKRCLSILLTLLTMMILALSILAIIIPILLLRRKSSTPPLSPIIVANSSNNITTVVTTTTTTIINCIYPNLISPLGTCVNIMIDSKNCGQLNNVCPGNSTCSAGICNNVPGIQLDNANAIFSSATNGSADDQMYKVTLPWNITLYNTTTNEVTVTSDGVLCLGNCSTSYTESRLPARVFDSATAFPFWDDLYIYANTSQGIYYQDEGDIPQRTLIFEYYMSHYVEKDQFYHFQVTFFENFPGVVQYKYFDATDHGDTCTIGVQASKTGPFIMYSYDQPNSVQTNMTIYFDTIHESFNVSNIN
ncbi:unnamed protein product [Rotaria socialis]|uniref:Uncharacterized protein n=1 Tax=Rotaria socialis TaxID=392032 RepID=A0A818F6R2_9BILA|nr:unnamed protein product [Rotaria socialis]CAF3428079.1 unnamed protein product [Rotaria socialis]CAF3469320.1 unnamed protein product [Rotaria socialis]CAF4195236.1 unnamed protein product [Rotaria socialis]CAF4410602.1 unnamed protein product [Rotaria socialis]